MAVNDWWCLQSVISCPVKGTALLYGFIAWKHVYKTLEVRGVCVKNGACVLARREKVSCHYSLCRLASVCTLSDLKGVHAFWLGAGAGCVLCFAAVGKEERLCWVALCFILGEVTFSMGFTRNRGHCWQWRKKSSFILCFLLVASSPMLCRPALSQRVQDAGFAECVYYSCLNTWTLCEKFILG